MPPSAIRVSCPAGMSAEIISLSAPGGGEGRGEVERGPSSVRRRPPHPPSAAAPGPSLSPLKGREGRPAENVVCSAASAKFRAQQRQHLLGVELEEPGLVGAG